MFDNIATLQERTTSIKGLKAIPREIKKFLAEVNADILLEKEMKEKINKEKSNFTKGETLIEDLENIFLNILNRVGMPSVSRMKRFLSIEVIGKFALYQQKKII